MLQRARAAGTSSADSAASPEAVPVQAGLTVRERAWRAAFVATLAVSAGALAAAVGTVLAVVYLQATAVLHAFGF